ATPMSIMVAVGRGAQAGVLVKNAEALERMEVVDTLVVDKTGTLTEGKPRVVAIVPQSGFDEDTVIRFAASLERSSEHPLAAAVVAEARTRRVDPIDAADFHAEAGMGAVGRIDGRRAALGNARFLETFDIATSAVAAEADRLRAEGATVMLLAV